MAKFNRQGAALLSKEMDTIIEEQRLGTYLVKAFENLASKGHRLNIQEISGLLWNDNDTIDDINKTQSIYSEIVKRNRHLT